MPIYEFRCTNKKCGITYEVLTSYDESDKYPLVKCPECGSKKKKKLASSFAFNFSDPVGTDKWNNSHDYRFNHKLPKAKAERERAKKAVKQERGFTSANPYNKIDDVNTGKYFGEVK